MRYALLLPLLLLSGCTLVPIADAGPCAAVTNSRGCQEKPYVIKRGDGGWSTTQSGASEKAATAR